MLNKIYILILFFACINCYAQPTRRDLDVYKGDSHTLSFEAPYDVSSDSLLFVVKADRDDDTPRVIALRNTAGGGSDSEIEVIYSAVSTILVKLTQINTEGLEPALYVYDLTIDSTTTLYTGTLKLRDEVGGSADGIATRTPYYTIVIDTPEYSPSFIIGQDLDNEWDVVSKSAFWDSLGIPGVYRLSVYDSLKAAIDSLGTTFATLLIDDSVAIGQSDTIPYNINLQFINEGKISISNANDTLLIWGTVQAPASMHIFDDDGTVMLAANPNGVYTEWFGAKRDGETDDSDAFTEAFASSKKVLLLDGEYKASFTMPIKSQLIGYGSKQRASQIVDGTGTTISTAVNGSYIINVEGGWNRIENLRLFGQDDYGSDTAKYGIYMGSDADNITLKNLWLQVFSYSGDGDTSYAIYDGAKDVSASSGVIRFIMENVHITSTDIGMLLYNNNATTITQLKLHRINMVGVWLEKGIEVTFISPDFELASNSGSDVIGLYFDDLNEAGNCVVSMLGLYNEMHPTDTDARFFKMNLQSAASLTTFTIDNFNAGGAGQDYFGEVSGTGGLYINISNGEIVTNNTNKKPILSSQSIARHIDLDILYHPAGETAEIIDIKEYNSDDYTHTAARNDFVLEKPLVPNKGIIPLKVQGIGVAGDFESYFYNLNIPATAIVNASKDTAIVTIGFKDKTSATSGTTNYVTDGIMKLRHGWTTAGANTAIVELFTITFSVAGDITNLQTSLSIDTTLQRAQTGSWYPMDELAIAATDSTIVIKAKIDASASVTSYLQGIVSGSNVESVTVTTK